MAEVVTTNGKYIYFDVVDFTHNRSVEAQSDIVATLNDMAKTAVSENGVSGDDVVYIPTGDGMCISLLDVDKPYDIHVNLGLHLLELLDSHNTVEEDPDRKFQIRIGVNENTDNVVVDVNGERNVAGAGISDAQRIMDLGDGGNLLLGAAVWERLRQRENYKARTRSFTATVKHDRTFPVHQLIDADIPYLNSDTPSQFVVQKLPTAPDPTLSPIAAYLIGYLIKYADDISRLVSRATYTHEPMFLVMIGLARAQVMQLAATNFAPHRHWDEPLPDLDAMRKINISATDDRDIDALFTYYSAVQFHLSYEAAKASRETYIERPGLSKFFDSQKGFLVPSEVGELTLRESWQQIVADLGL